jgi:hypothetical protein
MNQEPTDQIIPLIYGDDNTFMGSSSAEKITQVKKCGSPSADRTSDI